MYQLFDGMPTKVGVEQEIVYQIFCISDKSRMQPRAHALILPAMSTSQIRASRGEECAKCLFLRITGVLSDVLRSQDPGYQKVFRFLERTPIFVTAKDLKELALAFWQTARQNIVVRKCFAGFAGAAPLDFETLGYFASLQTGPRYFDVPDMFMLIFMFLSPPELLETMLNFIESELTASTVIVATVFTPL